MKVEHPLRYLRRCQGLVGMSRKYTGDEIDAGCASALTFDKYHLRFIEELIKTRKANPENNNEMTVTMNRLKMFGMLETLDTRLAEAQENGWSYSDFLSALVTDEKGHRERKSTEYKIRRARFRRQASFDQFDYGVKRNLRKSQIEELRQLSFVRNKQNLLMLGPTGVGKTFLATAIGYHACHEGFTCLFMGVSLFAEQTYLNRTAGTFLRFRDRLIRADLLILDDFGLKKFNPALTQDLYDILEERYQAKSTVITSQLPIANWKEVIEDEVALEAILDQRRRERVSSIWLTIQFANGSHCRKFGTFAAKGGHHPISTVSYEYG